MPIKTQMRMLQVTASLPSIIDLLPTNPTALTTNSDNSYPAGDLSGSLAYFAQTIQNIHGMKIIGDRAPGLIEHNAASIIRRGKSTSAQSILLGQNDGTADDGLKVELDSNGTAADSKIILENNRGTGVDAIKLQTIAAGDIHLVSARDVTVNATAVLDVDGASLALDTTGVQNFTAGDDITMKAADTKSIFIGEGNTATSTRFEVTHDAGAAANEKIVIHNQGGSDAGQAIMLKTATSGAGIRLDSAGVLFGQAVQGVDAIATGNNGFAIFGATGGGGSEVVQLVSSGTTQGAMRFMSKGGIDVTPAQGNVVDIGRPSDAQIVVAPHGTAANRDIRVLNTGGTDDKAVEVLATAGGIDVRAGKSLVLSGTSATGITFGLSEMTSGLGSNGMAFTTGDAECRTFIGKSIFANNTTVIGAFNALADSISGGAATVFTGSIAAAVAAGTAVPASVIGKLSGDNANLVPTVDRGQVQVYLNGQLLVSASNQGGNTLANDYAITGNNAITFQFQLEPGDFINVYDRS